MKTFPSKDVKRVLLLFGLELARQGKHAIYERYVPISGESIPFHATLPHNESSVSANVVRQIARELGIGSLTNFECWAKHRGGDARKRAEQLIQAEARRRRNAIK